MYSQNDEERVILEIFADQPQGHLLDIGAFDGKTFSNSLALIEKGWSGTLVEPNPTSLVALINLHGDNQAVEIVGGLVCIPQGMVKFHACPDAVSTTSEGFTELWKQAGVKYNPIWLPSVHPQEVAMMACRGGKRKVDFVTIDVEDGTLDLINGMKGFLAMAKAVCVEHSVGPHVIKDELTKIFVDELGFRLAHTTGENFIFVKD